MSVHRKRKLYTFRDFVESPSAKEFQPKRRRSHAGSSEREKRLKSFSARQLDLTFDEEDPVDVDDSTKQEHNENKETELSPESRAASSDQKSMKKVTFAAPSHTSGRSSQSLAFLTQRNPASGPQETSQDSQRGCTDESEMIVIKESIEKTNAPSSKTESIRHGTSKGRTKMKQTKLLFGERAFNHVNHARACRKHKASYRFSSQLSRLAEQGRSPDKKKDASQSSKHPRESQENSSGSSPPKSCQFQSRGKGASAEQSRSRNKSGNKKDKKKRKKRGSSTISSSSASQSQPSTQGDVSEDSPSASYTFPRHEMALLRQTGKSHRKSKEEVDGHFPKTDGTSQSLSKSQEPLQSQESQESLLESQLLDSQGFLVSDKNTGTKRKRENLLECSLQTIKEEAGEGSDEGEDDTIDNEETYVDEEMLLQAEVKSPVVKTPSKEDSEQVDVLSEWPSTGGFDIVTGGWEEQSMKEPPKHPQKSEHPHGIEADKTKSGNVAPTPEDNGDGIEYDINDSLTRIINQAEKFIGDDTRELPENPETDANGSGVPLRNQKNEMRCVDSAGRNGVKDRNHQKRDESLIKKHGQGTLMSSEEDSDDDSDVGAKEEAQDDHSQKERSPPNRKHQLPEGVEDTISSDRSKHSEEESVVVDDGKKTKLSAATDGVVGMGVLATETVDDPVEDGMEGVDETPMAIPETVEEEKSVTCNFTSDDEFDKMVNSAVDNCLRHLRSSSPSSDTTQGERDAGTKSNKAGPEASNDSESVLRDTPSSQSWTPTGMPPTSMGVGAHSIRNHVSQSRNNLSSERSKLGSPLSITKVSEIMLIPPEKVSVSIQTDISVLNDNELSAAFDFYQSAKEFVESYEREIGVSGASQSTESTSSENNFHQGPSNMSFDRLENGIKMPCSLETERLVESGSRFVRCLTREVPHEPIIDVQSYSDPEMVNGRVAKPLTQEELRSNRIKRKMKKLGKKKKQQKKNRGSITVHDHSEENAEVSADAVNGYRVGTSRLHTSQADMNSRVPHRGTDNVDDLPNQRREGDTSKQESGTDQDEEKSFVVDRDVNHEPHSRKQTRAKKKKKTVESVDNVDDLPNQRREGDTSEQESGTDQDRENLIAVDRDINHEHHSRKQTRAKKKKKTVESVYNADVLPNQRREGDTSEQESGTDQDKENLSVVDRDVNHEPHSRKQTRAKKKKEKTVESVDNADDLPNQRRDTSEQETGTDQDKENLIVVDKDVNHEPHSKKQTKAKKTKKRVESDDNADDFPNQRRDGDTSKQDSGTDQDKDNLIVVDKDVNHEPHSRKQTRAKKKKKTVESVDKDIGVERNSPVDLPVETDIPGPMELENLAKQRMSKLMKKMTSKKERKSRKRQKHASSGKSLGIAFRWEKLKSPDSVVDKGELPKKNSLEATKPSGKKLPKTAVQLPSPTSSDIDSIYDFNVFTGGVKRKKTRDETGSIQKEIKEASCEEEERNGEEDKEVAEVDTDAELDDITADGELDPRNTGYSVSGGDDTFVDFTCLPDVFVSRPKGYVMEDLTDL